MSITEVINLASSLASLILAILAIALAVYFYTQSKNTEARVSGVLEAIKAQTDTLQKIVGRQMGQLIRGVTDQPGGDYRAVYEMIGAIKEIPANVITLIQPRLPAAQPAQSWRQEMINGYLGAYYYSAVTNIANSYFLPPLDKLEEGNLFKRIQDGSCIDFAMIDRWLSSLDQQELKQSPSYHLYQETLTNWKPFVKDSTTVYHERATTTTPSQTTS